MAKPSPFLEPGLTTSPDSLAIVCLSRDNFQPVLLQKSSAAVDGYAEGATVNTRFGSFPHSTLLGVPWGSKIGASAVDTGSRGRKRRRAEVEAEDGQPAQDSLATQEPSQGEETPPTVPAKAVAASSGFVYILRPTAELWTSSLPHRTQVVYTPDYSYILQRIRARPGSRIIEAGAGSGSFTHAAVRAVYSGYPRSPSDSKGKVFSFEFHEPRFEALTRDIRQHGLDGLVEVTHRDVYQNGFLLDSQSPKATAVFLDLPAPWKALRQLARRPMAQGPGRARNDGTAAHWTSPLDDQKSVYICTFSPCIEQVTRTVAEMRTLGWTDIDVVEIAHRRLNVMRERVGVHLPAERGSNPTAADVEEALEKLKKDRQRTRDFHRAHLSSDPADSPAMELDEDEARAGSEALPPWMQGRVVHRTEAELKTHTSYLVFAILPREWTAEAEAAALARRPCGKESRTVGEVDKQTRKQLKRDMLATKRRRPKPAAGDAQAPPPAS